MINCSPHAFTISKFSTPKIYWIEFAKLVILELVVGFHELLIDFFLLIFIGGLKSRKLKDLKGPNDQHKCNTCDITYMDLDSLSQHILQEHKSETIVKWWCHHCNENKWAEEAWFQRHLKSCKHLHEKSKSRNGISQIGNQSKKI